MSSRRVICTIEARYSFGFDGQPLVLLRGLPGDDTAMTPHRWLQVAAQLQRINQDYAPAQHAELKAARQASSRWCAYEVLA